MKVKKVKIDSLFVNNNRLVFGDVKLVQTYKALCFPNIPSISPYNLSGDIEYPKFLITGNFKKNEYDGTLPIGAELLLKNNAIDIKYVDFAINIQNHPCRETPLELKFHPWIHPDAPLTFYVQDLEYNLTDYVTWSIIEANGTFSDSNLIQNDGVVTHTGSLEARGYDPKQSRDLSLLYSPDNMKLEDNGIKIDPEKNQAFFSLGMCPKKNKYIVTLHCLLNAQSSKELDQYIDLLKDQNLQDFNLEKLLLALNIDSPQALNFASNLRDKKEPMIFNTRKFSKLLEEQLKQNKKSLNSLQLEETYKGIEIISERLKPLNEKLLNAAASGDEKLLQEALNKEADINAIGSDGFSAIQLAILFGKVGVIKFMIEQGADLHYSNNAHRKNALALANDHKHINNDYAEIAKIINQHMEQLNNELLNAAASGDEKGIQKALDKGADINAINPKEHGEFNAIQLAILNGKVGVIKLMINNGADLNYSKNMYGKNAFALADGHKHINNDYNEISKIIGQLKNKLTNTL